MALSSLSALIQALIPEKYIERTFLLRNGVAITLSMLCISLCYQNIGDLCPLLAMMVACMAEAQGSSRYAQMGYIFGNLLWTGYAVAQGLPILLVAQCLIVASMFIAFVNHEQERKKLIPIRVRSS